VSILPGKTLLFLDEIQARPHILVVLRYFYEKMADLHVIAAGSLLEFALEQPAFSMPVGRIEYLHLGPMQFEEYLVATGNNRLVRFLNEFTLDSLMSDLGSSAAVKSFAYFYGNRRNAGVGEAVSRHGVMAGMRDREKFYFFNFSRRF